MREIEFASGGTRCRALHFTPGHDQFAAASGIPCIILAHGFGGTRDAGLLPYAQAFSATGLHALVFDYRHFGASDGEPRQLISIGRQLEDWRAAIACARSLPGADPARIVLWGISFAGGHVIRTAARDRRIRAVIAQFPLLDGLAAMLHIGRYAGRRQLLALLRAAVKDQLHAITGRAAITLPIVAAPGRLAALSTPDAEPGYLAIAPADWRNAYCARIALTMPFYRPGIALKRIEQPVLIQIASRDDILPPASQERCIPAGRPLLRVRHYPVGHFDAFAGQAFERCVSDQIHFLIEHLRE